MRRPTGSVSWRSTMWPRCASSSRWTASARACGGCSRPEQACTGGVHCPAMATVASRVERFNGFSDEAIQFFLELQAEQSRTWFKAHQADYLRLCRRPLELVVSELQARLLDVYTGGAAVE